MNEAEIKAGDIYVEKTKKTNTNSQQYQYLTQSEKKSDPKYGLYISIIMILFLSIILFCLFVISILLLENIRFQDVNRKFQHLELQQELVP